VLHTELEKKGYSVTTRRMLADDRQAICMIQPDFLVVPELRCEYTVNLAKQFRQWGGKVIVRLCEVGITKDSIEGITEEYRRAIFGNFPINDAVDLVLAWGPKQAELIKKYSDVEASKIVSIGGIAFDQYFMPFKQPERTGKPVILMATGFPYADRNLEFAIPEAMCGEELHKTWVLRGRKGRSTWLRMIRMVHAYHGDKYDINVLPHPGEHFEGYEATLRGIGRVVKGSSAFIEVNMSDIIVHAGSTIGYEAHLLNKPAFNYHNVCDDIVSSKLSPNIDNPIDLLKAIEAVELGKSNADPKILKKLEDGYYGPVDGKAYMRCIDAIDKLDKPEKLTIPEQWPKETQPLKDIDKDIALQAAQWHCSACSHNFFVTAMHREMVKCPWCGISCVRIMPKNKGS
jgi:surface carbohydrate biosynthesis protein